MADKTSLEKAQESFEQGRKDGKTEQPARPSDKKFQDAYFQGYETGHAEKKKWLSTHQKI